MGYNPVAGLSSPSTEVVKETSGTDKPGQKWGKSPEPHRVKRRRKYMEHMTARGGKE